jgi:hypothetical protein
MLFTSRGGALRKATQPRNVLLRLPWQARNLEICTEELARNWRGSHHGGASFEERHHQRHERQDARGLEAALASLSHCGLHHAAAAGAHMHTHSTPYALVHTAPHLCSRATANSGARRAKHRSAPVPLARRLPAPPCSLPAPTTTPTPLSLRRSARGWRRRRARPLRARRRATRRRRRLARSSCRRGPTCPRLLTSQHCFHGHTGIPATCLT